MTSKQDLESSLIGYINAGFKAQFPSVPLVWGNEGFDYNNPPDVYVEARVSMDHTEQLAVNSTVDRHYGNIHFTAITKSGLGTLISNQVIEWIYRAYEHATVGTTEVRGAKFNGEGPGRDGYEMSCFVPFITAPL